MAESFDPYYKWLGIPRQEQPPNHYRLLAINLFENDSDVIEAAADRQMSHLRSYQTGKHSTESQKLLNECAAARVTLLNPQKKADYDRQLRERLASEGAHDRSVGNALRGVPQVAAEDQGEHVSPRSLPRAKRLRQSQALWATPAAPLIDAGASTAIARRSAHRRNKKPAWLLPAASVGSAIVLALVTWIVLRPSGTSYVANQSPNKTDDLNSSNPTIPDSNADDLTAAPLKEMRELSPTITDVAPAALGDPMPQKTPAMVADNEPGAIAAEAASRATIASQDDGEILNITLAPGVAMRLVKIPASEDGKIKSFFLGETEVTQRQWTAVMGAPPVKQQAEGGDLPIAFVSYHDCNLFAARLTELADGSSEWQFRLPTKEEFAYGYLAGQDPTSAYLPEPMQYGWLREESADAPHPVAQKRTNALGLYDMLGNVWEWASDCRFYGMSAADSFVEQPHLAIALTSVLPPHQEKYETYRGWNLGFRIAATIADGPAH